MCTEAEDRLHCACFTGHRPEKLRQTEQEVCIRLDREIQSAVENGFHTFITGMARGVDLWAAELVLQLRAQGCAVRLVCASSYEGFERSWSAGWQSQYRAVLQRADQVHFICLGYSRACFQRRNEWMVDHAALVIAAFNGQPGGTKNTLDDAMRKGTVCRNLLADCLRDAP